MALHTPGSFIHFRPSGSRQPMWPAVVCTDDVAPADFLQTRPPGFVTLVLRVGESLDLCWAFSTEMHDYDPFVPFEEEDMVGRTPGLGEAYAVANSALEAGLSLDHWRHQVRNNLTITLSDDDEESIGEEKEDDLDPDLRTALRLSRQEYRGRQPQGSSNSFLSPFKQTQLHNVTRALRKDSGRTKKSFQPPLVRKRYHSPEGSMLPRHRHELQTPPSSYSDYEISSPQTTKPSFKSPENRAPQLAEEANNSSGFTLNSGSGGLLSWGRLGKPSSVPASDVVEGHLAASKDFVLIRVGAEREERLLHLKCVWGRPYFLNMGSGINFFGLNDDGIWELRHPGLANIEPEDFNYVAEYLESNSFGYIHPQGEEETNEAFVQIMSASGSAEKLGMTDLMEHVVEKLERLTPWDLWNILYFACRVYASLGPHFPVQERLKDMLATEIAQNYWIYIEDDHLSTGFIQRLKDLPELERDINARRLVALNARLNSDGEEEDKDEDEDEEDENENENEKFDLYED